MTTRMVHPEHGATHAYDKGEVERLKGIGWSVETLPSLVAITTHTTVLEINPKPTLAEKLDEAQKAVQAVEKRKPGRPPKAK